MKTANDVLAAIDSKLVQLKEDAAGPCIDALLNPIDSDIGREALRRGITFQAVSALRDELGKGVSTEPQQRKRSRKRSAARSV